MRIPINFDKDGRPNISLSIRVPSQRIYGFMTVYFDTGSPDTIISEGDALRLQIPISKLPPSQNVYGWGGSSLSGHELRNASITMKDVDEKPFSVTMPKVLVTESRKENQKIRSISLLTPSVIGTDFLLVTCMKVMLDPTNKVGYFEKDSELK